MNRPVKIGVSACLLGEKVRYDGGHRLNRYIIDTLGRYLTFVPVCPEAESGMPIPRETMRLEGEPATPRLMTCRTRIDMTGQMLAYCSAKVVELEGLNLCGFIFKERSPSCGLTMVPLYGDGAANMLTVGLFAEEVARSFPSMALEEAEHLNDPSILQDFIEKVLSCHRRCGKLSH